MSKRYYKLDRFQGMRGVLIDYVMSDAEKRSVRRHLRGISDSDFEGFIFDVQVVVEIALTYRDNPDIEPSFIEDELKAIAQRATLLTEILSNCHQQSVEYILDGYLLSGGKDMNFLERLVASITMLKIASDRMLLDLKGSKTISLEKALGIQLTEVFRKWLPNKRISKSKDSPYVKVLGELLSIVGSKKTATAVAAAVKRRMGAAPSGEDKI